MKKIPIVAASSPSDSDSKIHVKLTEGRYQTRRRLFSGSLLGLFFITAWFNVGGHQAVLFDFPTRRIYLFGLQVGWQDFTILAGLLIFSACLLLAVSTIRGRLWCGFSCPQSIWTWLFIRIETLVEGPRSKRIRMATRGMSQKEKGHRVLKHLLWLLAAALTAITFTGYFIPIRDLAIELIQFNATAVTVSWLITMTLLTYANAGLVREKVCLHMCPYARFQSVMFDEHTQTVAYDANRGEPRSMARNAGADAGDCVDCNLCVQVCPTGIDIRDGLQYECIDCGACIDACDQVMEKIKRPTGLIRFDSEHVLEGNVAPKYHPKTAIYALLLIASFSLVILGGLNRHVLEASISRDRGQLYTLNNEGQICNHYTVKVESFDPLIQSLNVRLDGPSNLILVNPSSIKLVSGEPKLQTYTICATEASARTPIAFELSQGDLTSRYTTTFIGPTQ